MTKPHTFSYTPANKAGILFSTVAADNAIQKPSIVPFRSTKRIPLLHFGHSYLEGINPSFITQSKTALFPCSPRKTKNPVVASLSSNFISQAIPTTSGKSSQKSEHVGKKVRAGVNSTCCSRVKGENGQCPLFTRFFLLDRF
ncbi:hypothetical protein TNCV_3288871 [Trichonephila clavipes]|nr:hypothetical protein TNCV_3288871 [Trichonephila clavipes]